jgi:hypothetical protein
MTRPLSAGLDRTAFRWRVVVALALGLGLGGWDTARAAPVPADPAAAAVAAATAAAKQLADRLKKDRSPKPPPEGNNAIYMMDLDTREVTLVASEADDSWGRTYFGSPAWSRDGTRIYYDAQPLGQIKRTQIYLIEAAGEGVRRTVVGPGNCPAPSPDGRHLAVLLNDVFVEGGELGIHVTPSRGGRFRPLDFYGLPLWSPDGRELLASQFSDPTSLTLVNADEGGRAEVALADHTFHSVPCWVKERLFVSVVRSGSDPRVVLVDVTNPAAATIKETLWREDDSPAKYVPLRPVYAPAARRGVFIGRELNDGKEQRKNPQQLYVFEPGKPAKPLEPGRRPGRPNDPALSPDGRYLLFADVR